MLDVCFDSSTCGNLNAIKYTLNNLINSDGILNLDLQLNYGLLDGDIYATQANFEARIHKSFFKDISDKKLGSWCKQKLRKIHSSLSKLEKKLKNDGEIRLWLSNNAFDRCGLYWFCDYAKDYNSRIHIVVCPEYELDSENNKLVQNTRWAAFTNMSYMASFVKTAKELSKKEISFYSELWQNLIKENAQLRVLIDNKIISTTADFFDKTILSYVGDEPKPQVTIIGNFLSDWYCTDYGFVSERIEFLIKQGYIEIVEDRVNNEGSYVVRTLRRVKN